MCAYTKNISVRLVGWDRGSKLVSRASDDHSELELKIEFLWRAEDGRSFAIGHCERIRAPNGRAANDYRRRAAVICDRQVHERGRKRLLAEEDGAAVLCVLDVRHEVRELGHLLRRHIGHGWSFAVTNIINNTAYISNMSKFGLDTSNSDTNSSPIIKF